MELKIIEDITFSQLGQDLWILESTNNKRNGFFVDFGATDGKTINNTFFLETKYDWKGIVAEPNPVYHKELENNRNCIIVKDAVFTSSGEVIDFDIVSASDLSTISGYGKDDEYQMAREQHETIKVKTISLFDLLENNSAPNDIDFLSIDTEGSEYDILEAFFKDDISKKYNIQYITVEHNYTNSREKIYKLLENNGYMRECEMYWDDFYKRK